MGEDTKKLGKVVARVHASTEAEIKRIAKAEDRKPGAVVRRLLESALRSREQEGEAV